ncbi:hypothetical protein ACFZB9_28760 [Kitasatospora sp. NPDC008050]|uniref:hypothetical protein n=1 Tax=Kitasatospora sp. NPDC008050 TaxID=3364021 RepID=UPI0036EAD9D6
MRMPAFSRIAAHVVSRRALATGVATLALGAALPLLSGGTPAWACGDAPARTVVPTPVQSQPAPRGNVGSGFVPGFADTITAGGPAVEVGEEVTNFTGVAYDGITPQLSFANALDGTGTFPRLQDLDVQVMVDGSWRTLPMLHGCDPAVHADTSSLAQHLENGRATRFMFRVSLSANAPADLHDFTMYSGPDAQGKVPSHVLKVVRPAATPAPAPSSSSTPAPANPAEENGFRAGFFMMGTKPLTITPGGAPLEIDVEAGKDSGAPYQDVRPELVLSSDNSPRFVGRPDVVLELRTADGWQPVPVRSTGHYSLTADLSGIKGSPMVNGHAVHFTYRLALKAGAAQNTTNLQVRVSAVAENGRGSDSQVRDLTVLHPTTAPAKTPAPAPTRQATAPAAPAAATSAAPTRPDATEPTATQPATPAAVAPGTGSTGSSSPTATPRLAFTGGGSSALPLAGAGGALVLLGAGALVVTRRRRATHH